MWYEDREEMLGITNNKTILRYMPADKVIYLLRYKKLYLPTAVKYEDSDLNEARFSRSYVNVVRNWFRKSFKDDDSTDLFFTSTISNLLAAREVSFISCWTHKDKEDAKLWEYFANDFSGVAIYSTIQKVNEELFNFCEENSPFDVRSNAVTYDRENAHTYIDGANEVDDYHLPFFFLDGDSDPDTDFEHEQEYRFILYNAEELQKTSERLFVTDSVSFDGNHINISKFRRRVNTKKQRGKSIKVPVDLSNLLIKISLGSRISKKNEKIIRRLIERNCPNVLIVKSKCLPKA
ncbi:MAG: DUF2971 domain-containing protein [Bdellovibrionales bacterium]|nr:DUF2971 domain-containing protein [Bdellovibrionales bacterium]